MFEFILIAILAYYLYRRYSKRPIQAKKKRTRPYFYASSKPTAAEGETHPPSADEGAPRGERARVIEEMKRCPACGTFNPKSYALYFEGEYFCGMDCRNQRN